MKYLLDTNTCIYYINGKSSQLSKRFNTLSAGEAVVCSVVKAELFFGALRSQNPPKNLNNQRQFLALFSSLPFDDNAAEHYANIRADLVTKGMPIGSNDFFIAAIARANGLILVTSNTREFSRVPNLICEDWL
jgi:tRNA(fMet)-specific endonuclease VapC